jgi:hypothetical protein
MIFKSFTCLFALFLLSGCATLNIVSFGLSGISFITTGKSLSDHALSAVTDQDCAIHRFIFNESMCRQNNDIVETNGAAILAKNAAKEETQVPIQSLSVIETVIPEITRIKVNNAESTLVAKNNVVSDNESEKQFGEGTQSFFETKANTVAQYKVIGSFNNKSYAITRANLYQEMGAMVIANGKTDSERQIKVHDTKYRVVLGPYLTNTQSPEIGQIAKTEKSPDWMLSLCTITLSPPPCLNENITLASTY